MLKSILKINIENELDVVLAYRRAIQLSELTGMALSAQTKFATAVSEICRNVVEHVGLGYIEYSLAENKGQLFLEALVSDNGRGIFQPENLLSRKFPPGTLKGKGLFNSRRLVDDFQLESVVEKGTKVWLRQRIPAGHPPINNAILQGWREHFQNDSSVSPYAELKRQNQQLIQLLDQLRLRNLEVEHQLEEITRLNQELEKANAEVTELLHEREHRNALLQEANEVLDSFAYTVSHDLKAPLRNIEGLTTAILDSLRTEDLEDARECAGLMQEQLNRMDTLIAGILINSRSGAETLEKKRVELTPFVKLLLSTLRVPPGFTVSIQPDMPVLVTEEVPLSQVLTNLMVNAIKHHDLPDGQIRIGSAMRGDHVLIYVEDNGPGIRSELQEQIFYAFVRNAFSSLADSTGLGLAIVKRLVTQRGGEVWVESDGRGARFCFTWPAHSPAAGADVRPDLDVLRGKPYLSTLSGEEKQT